MNETTAKVYIHFSGDPQVGIFSYDYEMTIPRESINAEGREWVRENIKFLYYDLDTEQVPMVIFDDEKFD